MRYIQADIKYESGAKWLLILEYNTKTSRVRTILSEMVDENGVKYDFNNDPINFSATTSNTLDALNINLDILNFSSTYKATFEQVINIVEESCNNKYNRNTTGKCKVREIPKSKVFVKML